MATDLFPNLPNIVARSNNLMAVGSRSGVLKIFDLGPAHKNIAEIIVRTPITSVAFVHSDSAKCVQVAVMFDLRDINSEAITFCTNSKHHVCDKSNPLKNEDNMRVVA
ncbi:hypothetical protein B0H13DRAFT_1887975 [Mycena leptocephala]|nr:hypothetical protein B0H13DRAFT_1887975 [Mycena leptocephala]